MELLVAAKCAREQSGTSAELSSVSLMQLHEQLDSYQEAIDAFNGTTAAADNLALLAHSVLHHTQQIFEHKCSIKKEQGSAWRVASPFNPDEKPYMYACAPIDRVCILEKTLTPTDAEKGYGVWKGHCYSEGDAFGSKGRCGKSNETRKQAAYTNKKNEPAIQDFCFAKTGVDEHGLAFGSDYADKLVPPSDYIKNLKKFNVY
uniref:Uncharacterized protein n=1 Tax=Vitrella brassicaformis TaxID=1169539 RepID=A0A7S1K5G4_9ALVE